MSVFCTNYITYINWIWVVCKCLMIYQNIVTMSKIRIISIRLWTYIFCVCLVSNLAGHHINLQPCKNCIYNLFWNVFYLIFLNYTHIYIGIFKGQVLLAHIFYIRKIRHYWKKKLNFWFLLPRSTCIGLPTSRLPRKCYVL